VAISTNLFAAHNKFAFNVACHAARNTFVTLGDYAEVKFTIKA
jgi:hypothetical protein